MIKEIYLAGRCFWGTQHYLKQIKGVLATEVGYANGNTEGLSVGELLAAIIAFIVGAVKHTCKCQNNSNYGYCQCYVI